MNYCPALRTQREQREMLDADLAELYGVQTKVLVQAVKRNLARFPQDLVFQLSVDELTALRSKSFAVNRSLTHPSPLKPPIGFVTPQKHGNPSS